MCSSDLGRPHLSFGLQIPAQMIGTYDTELVKEFYVAVANNAGLTLHIRMLDGVNSHHIVEASFKAFARALRMATEVDPRRADSFYAAVRTYWPDLKDGALQPGYSGIRPKTVPKGAPGQDFVVQGTQTHGIPGLINLFGIESPGLTASLAIADHVLEVAATG